MRKISNESKRLSGCWLVAVSFAFAHHAAHARPSKVGAGDPCARVGGVMKNVQAGGACDRLIIVISPTERRIAKLQGRHVNDVAEEQEMLLVGVERVADMTGSMTRQGDGPQPLSHVFAIPYGSQQGPELRKMRLSAKVLHGRLGYRDFLQVRKEHAAVGSQKPVQMILMGVSQCQDRNRSRVDPGFRHGLLKVAHSGGPTSASAVDENTVNAW